MLVDKETCFLFSSAEAMANYLNSLLKEKSKSTVSSAYDCAKSHSLLNLGKELSSLYNKLIQDKKGTLS